MSQQAGNPKDSKDAGKDKDARKTGEAGPLDLTQLDVDPMKGAGSGASKAASPAAPRPAHQETAPALGAVTVEVFGKKNFVASFDPAARRLRSHWSPQKLNHGEQSSVGLFKFPEIPGMLITVDVPRRLCRIDDPLARPENQQLMAQISRQWESSFGTRVKPEEPHEEAECSDETLVTWLYWIMRLVEAGQAVVRAGRLPAKRDDLKDLFPGVKAKTRFYEIISDTSPQGLVRAVLEAAGQN